MSQSLAEKLAAFKAAFIQRAPEQIRQVIQQANDDLRASGALDRSVKVGDQLAAFELPNQDGAIIRSDDLLARGPLVLSFFRGVWCPYCNLELEALGEIAGDLRALGANLVVISPQNAAKAAESRVKNRLDVDVLVDSGCDYAAKLGVSFTLPEHIQTIYRGFNIDLPTYNASGDWRLPIPTRLIVMPTGRIVYAEIDVDYTNRPEPAATLAALKRELAAIQR